MSSDATEPAPNDAPLTHDLAMLGRVAVVGVGAAGTAMARAFAARGAHVVALAGRSPDRMGNARALAPVLSGVVRVTSAQEAAEMSDFVLLAVPDDVIAAMAHALPWRSGQTVAHLSGSQGTEVLTPVREHGASAASLHPLMTFSRPDLTEPVSALLERLAGATWTIETEDATTRNRLEAVVAALGGRPLALPSEARIPYHIAAVFAANYVVGLLGGSATLWETFGAGADEALRALLPLLRAAVDRLAVNGLPQALSGPLARGDINTVRAHLAWLDAHAHDSPDLARVRAAYLALADLSLPLAEAKGTLAPDRVAELATLLSSEATSGNTRQATNQKKDAR